VVTARRTSAAADDLEPVLSEITTVIFRPSCAAVASSEGCIRNVPSPISAITLAVALREAGTPRVAGSLVAHAGEPELEMQ
jgi:hypothetical protein